MNPNEPKQLFINKDEINYLSQKYEIRDSRDLFAWGIKLIHDLSKLDEGGWKFALTKSTINTETKSVETSPDYKTAHFSIDWFAPNGDIYPRLPPPEIFEQRFKIKTNE